MLARQDIVPTHRVDARRPRSREMEDTVRLRRSSLAIALAIALTAALMPPGSTPAAAAPEGQITFAIHVSLAPTWFDPAETPGVITPFMTLYALHDALVKPMPGNPWAPSLAESWTASKDGLDARVRPAQGRPVSQRRSPHRRGREVLLRALQGGGRLDPQGARGRRRGGRSAPRALPLQAAVARLHDVLRHAGHRRRLDRPQEVHRARRARRASRRRRSGPDRTASCPSIPASSWWSRRTTATGARCPR